MPDFLTERWSDFVKEILGTLTPSQVATASKLAVSVFQMTSIKCEQFVNNKNTVKIKIDFFKHGLL